MGAYASNLELPLGSHLRDAIQHSLKRKISSFLLACRFSLFFFFLFDCCQAEASLCRLRWYWVTFVLNINTAVFMPQVSAQPQKTSPTRSRTCGQSAAQTLEERTLWPVQMGRSQATVGECHIPARLAKPSVRCLPGENSRSQSYQSLSPPQLPPNCVICSTVVFFHWDLKESVKCSVLVSRTGESASLEDFKW